MLYLQQNCICTVRKSVTMLFTDITADTIIFFNTGVHYTMKKRKDNLSFFWLLVFSHLFFFQVPISAEEADQSAAVEASGTISTNSISGWPQASDISSEAAVVMENTTNTILYSKNADEVLFPLEVQSRS